MREREREKIRQTDDEDDDHHDDDGDQTHAPAALCAAVFVEVENCRKRPPPSRNTGRRTVRKNSDAIKYSAVGYPVNKTPELISSLTLWCVIYCYLALHGPNIRIILL